MHVHVVTFLPSNLIAAVRSAANPLARRRAWTWLDAGAGPDELLAHFDHDRTNLLVLSPQLVAVHHQARRIESLDLRLALWDATLLLLDGSESESTLEAVASVCATALAPRLAVSSASAGGRALALEVQRLAMVAGMGSASLILDALPDPLRAAFRRLPAAVQLGWRELLAQRAEVGFKAANSHFGRSRRSLERVHRAVGLPAPGVFLDTVRELGIDITRNRHQGESCNLAGGGRPTSSGPFSGSVTSPSSVVVMSASPKE